MSSEAMSSEPNRATHPVGEHPVLGPGVVPVPGLDAGPRARTLVRFGLREFAAGMLSVVVLGVLNRVMKSELGIGLALAATIVATYNLASPLALWIGRRTDKAGVRTPTILWCAMLAACAAAVAPFGAFAIADLSGAGRALAVAATFAVFVVLGSGMYGAGTAYFALLAEITPSHRRGRAAAIVYSMLMAGIMAGVGLTAVVMAEYSRARLIALFVVVAVSLVALTWVGVRGIERNGIETRIAAGASRRGRAHEAVPTWRDLARAPAARRFFVFMVGATFFAFLQQAVLEPFGADVFDLSVRATTAFNGEQVTGVLIGMLVAGRWWSSRWGDRKTTAVGLTIMAAAFAGLAAAAVAPSLSGVHYAIVAMGFGLGVFSVGGLTLMMGMTAPGVVGAAMGAWTLAHALADGSATALGGVIHDVALALGGTESVAYATVFAIEAIGLLLVIRLLRGLSELRTEPAAPA